LVLILDFTPLKKGNIKEGFLFPLTSKGETI